MSFVELIAACVVDWMGFDRPFTGVRLERAVNVVFGYEGDIVSAAVRPGSHYR